MSVTSELKTYYEFTDQEKRYVDGYTDPESDTYKNKVQSYISAGYYIAKVPEGEEDDGRAYRAARQKALQLSRKPHIAAEVERRLEAQSDIVSMKVPEIVERLSRVAEADLSDYLVLQDCACPHCGGDISGMVSEYRFDVERMREDGLGFLLKKMRPTKAGIEFEFYGADASMDRLMKYYGGYKANQSTGNDLSAFDEVILAARKTR